MISEDERKALSEARDRIRSEFLFSHDHRRPTTGRGIHHTALICRDVATTVERYRCVAGFPQDPDGARIEFIHDPLGEMYGEPTV